jgi:hypothetical protein
MQIKMVFRRIFISLELAETDLVRYKSPLQVIMVVWPSFKYFKKDAKRLL